MQMGHICMGSAVQHITQSEEALMVQMVLPIRALATQRMALTAVHPAELETLTTTPMAQPQRRLEIPYITLMAAQQLVLAIQHTAQTEPLAQKLAIAPIATKCLTSQCSRPRAGAADFRR